MKIAIYPGSFDPVTLGHLNIIERSSKIFDKLIVCVMTNSDKKPMFTAEERVALIQRVAAHLPNVEVDHSSELLAEYAIEKGSCVVIKGLRAMTDFEKEMQMAQINKTINPSLDTMFLTADGNYTFLSSSAVKELGRFQADLSGFIPAAIIEDVKTRIDMRRNETLGGASNG